jgi:putative exosortase-associated protein (TIGR04073 family)
VLCPRPCARPVPRPKPCPEIVAAPEECEEPEAPAKDCRRNPEADFYANPVSKFARGVTNTATGWIEVPKQIYKTSRDHDPVTGLLAGTAKGVVDGTVRTLGGVFDVATFPIPPYSKPLVCPEFVFEGWDECE